MAVYQILFILVNIAFLTRGEVTNTNWTTIYQFWPISSEDSHIVLEPKYNQNTNSTGYSICLRLFIWMRGKMYVFNSPAVQLYLYLFDSSGICFTMTEYFIEICFTGQLSSEWNALCFTHNITDSVFNVTLNGEQIHSEKLSLTRNFLKNLLKKLAEPFSIGLKTPFWGKISDFNIWSRPLSIEELNQYSFGCLEGLLTQPEILDWANTDITNVGSGSEYIQMQRQPQTCQYNITKSYNLFQNALAMNMNYNKSIEFCKFFKGYLVDPFTEDLSQMGFQFNDYWVPTIYSTPVNKTINTTDGQKADQCMGVELASKEYLPKKCTKELDFVCKVYN
jgi:hypothetical protein